MQPKATFHFSKEFLWGASYPTYLTPQEITNNNWENWINISTSQNRQQDHSSPTWKDDFEKAKSIGLNTVLLTIDWSRVQPAQNQWNENAIEFYRKMVLNLLEKNIQPMIILHHLSQPLWFYESGGWEKVESIQFYLKYVEKMVTALKSLCSFWITFFEPNRYLLNAHMLQNYPPGSNSIMATRKAYNNIRHAHDEAYYLIHKLQTETQVALSPNFINYFPARNQSLLDHLVLPFYNSFYNHAIFTRFKYNFFTKTNFLKKYTLPHDFLLVSFYGDQEIKIDFQKPVETFDLTTAKGLWKLLDWASSFKKPIYILSSNPDFNQTTYLLTCLHTIWKTANLNPNICGFIYHSLIDGFEWNHNFDLKTGLFEKTAKQSNLLKRNTTELYKNIIQNNSISFELINNTNPPLINKFFP